MRRGLATMVPVRALSLFTWQEVETLVAGKPDVDIALLKRHTRYEQYTASHPVIRRFWRVFASLTQEDRSRYVRFVWGRSRLPSDGGTWTSSHTIQKQSGGDRTLPMAHTCFFTIGACPLCGPVIALRLAALPKPSAAADLPEYTTDERMRWGLLTAIAYGQGGILNS